MPTKQQLLAAGRHDLVALISKVGGFAQVALLLGFKAPRRPVGYWDNLETLDTELDQFIAGKLAVCQQAGWFWWLVFVRLITCCVLVHYYSMGTLDAQVD
eukprot:GHRR01032260.1.p2 GENE.GHRR01032260.1~~GHRR01032260.1.p2  ORF type:complete len:100 (+),score=26.57 GHRR01032260.1:1348-1647(+)